MIEVLAFLFIVVVVIAGCLLIEYMLRRPW